MNAEMLRSSILQKAIEGSLVPQLEEEPGAEQIGETLNEVPFKIPDKWKWVLLGNIGTWKSGATPSRSHPAYYKNGTINWLKTGDLNDGIVTETDEKITAAAVSESGLKINPPGSVLIAMYGATIGKVGILDIPSSTNQACCACVPEDFVDNKYLFYFLLSQRKRFVSMGAGGAQPNISKSKIINFPFPLPAIEEQRRIVAKLEALLPLIDEYGRDQKQLEKINKDFPVQMEKSFLQEAISGKLVPQRDDEPEVEHLGETPDEVPFEIPEKWKWVLLGDIGAWKSGSTPSRSNPSYYKNGTVNWLKTGDLNDGIITKTDEKITNIAVSESRLKINPPGSVLIAMYGATIGKVGILDVPSTTNQACCACVPEDFVDNKYLFYFLLSQRKRFISMGAGGAQPNISKNKIVNFPFPLPPIKEQRRIVEKLDKLMLEIRKLK